MTLILENVKDEFVPTIKALSKAINAKCKIEKPKATKLEKELLLQLQEIEEKRKKGTLKTYTSAKEMHAELFNTHSELYR